MPTALRKFPILLFVLTTSVLCSRAWSQTTNAAPVNAVDTYMHEGAAAGSRGDLDGAIAAFTEAIKADPTLADAYVKRGMALFFQHKTTDALADFDKAIQLNPKDAEAYYQRGSTKGEAADFDGALADFNQAIELQPNYAMAFYNRGHVKYFKGDLKGALDDLNQAITLNPKHAPSYWVRGVVQLAQESPAPALADFKESLKDGFAYGAFWVWIDQKENSDRAVADNNLAAATSNSPLFKPNDWPSTLAGFLLGKVTQDQLVAKARESDDVPAHLCEAWFYIGMSNRFLGDIKSAKVNFQQAIDTGSNQSEEMVEARRELAFLQSE